jgi:hypothetical protein
MERATSSPDVRCAYAGARCDSWPPLELLCACSGRDVGVPPTITPSTTTAIPPTEGDPVEIERVGVVGCGLMGSGVAEAVARAGLNVKVVDLAGAAIERASIVLASRSLEQRDPASWPQLR